MRRRPKRRQRRWRWPRGRDGGVYGIVLGIAATLKRNSSQRKSGESHLEQNRVAKRSRTATQVQRKPRPMQGKRTSNARVNAIATLA